MSHFGDEARHGRLRRRNAATLFSERGTALGLGEAAAAREKEMGNGPLGPGNEGEALRLVLTAFR